MAAWPRFWRARSCVTSRGWNLALGGATAWSCAECSIVIGCCLLSRDRIIRTCTFDLEEKVVWMWSFPVNKRWIIILHKRSESKTGLSWVVKKSSKFVTNKKLYEEFQWERNPGFSLPRTLVLWGGSKYLVSRHRKVYFHSNTQNLINSNITKILILFSFHYKINGSIGRRILNCLIIV